MDNLYLSNISKGSSNGLGVLQKNMIQSYQEHFVPHTGGGFENYEDGYENAYGADYFLEGGKKKKQTGTKRTKKTKRSSKRRSARGKKSTVKTLIRNSMLRGGLRKAKKSTKTKKSKGA